MPQSKEERSWLHQYTRSRFTQPSSAAFTRRGLEHVGTHVAKCVEICLTTLAPTEGTPWYNHRNFHSLSAHKVWQACNTRLNWKNRRQVLSCGVRTQLPWLASGNCLPEVPPTSKKVQLQTRAVSARRRGKWIASMGPSCFTEGKRFSKTCRDSGHVSELRPSATGHPAVSKAAHVPPTLSSTLRTTRLSTLGLLSRPSIRSKALLAPETADTGAGKGARA